MTARKRLLVLPGGAPTRQPSFTTHQDDFCYLYAPCYGVAFLMPLKQPSTKGASLLPPHRPYVTWGNRDTDMWGLLAAHPGT